jgi:hypothetical protein
MFNYQIEKQSRGIIGPKNMCVYVHIYIYIFFFSPFLRFFSEMVSLHVAQAGLDHTFLLPLPPGCWDFRHASPTSGF